LAHSDHPFAERPLEWDLSGLPVPAEILVYTVREWKTLLAEANAFARRVATETVWVPLSG
jgi:hypothetical protein